MAGNADASIDTTGTVACWIIISSMARVSSPDSSQSARRAASPLHSRLLPAFTQYRIGPAVRQHDKSLLYSVSAAFRVSMGSGNSQRASGESLILTSLCLTLHEPDGRRNGFFRCFRPGCIWQQGHTRRISGSRIASLCWRKLTRFIARSPVGCRKRGSPPSSVVKRRIPCAGKQM